MENACLQFLITFGARLKCQKLNHCTHFWEMAVHPLCLMRKLGFLVLERTSAVLTTIDLRACRAQLLCTGFPYAGSFGCVV